MFFTNANRLQFDTKKSAWPNWLTCLLIFVVATQLIYEAYGWQVCGIFCGVDDDQYVRLLKVQQLLATGDWFNRYILSGHPPYGIAVIWPHFQDLLIIIATLPFYFLMPLKQALLASTFLLAFIERLIIARAAVWAVENFKIQTWDMVLISLLALFINAIFYTTWSGRAADHHSTFIILYILVFSSIWRSQNSELHHPQKWLIGAGIALGCGLWEGQEFLLILALVCVTFVIPWFFHATAQLLSDLAILLLSTTIILCLGLFFEHPISALFTVENDHLSIVHIAILSFASLVIVFCQLLYSTFKLTKIWQKLLTLAFLSITALAILQLAFPEFYLGPLNIISPKLTYWWGQFNVEFQMGMIGYFCYAIPCIHCMMLWFRIRKKTSYGLFYELSFAFTLISLTICAYITARWNYYLYITIVMLLFIILKELQFLKNSSKFIRSTIYVFLFATLFITLNDDHAVLNTEVADRNATCHEALVKQLVNHALDPIIGTEPKLIFIAANNAMPIMWFTQHGVLTNNNANQPTELINLNKFYRTNSEQTAYNIIQKYQPDYIMVCDQGIYENPENTKYKTSLTSSKIPENINPNLNLKTFIETWLANKQGYAWLADYQTMPTITKPAPIWYVIKPKLK